MRTIFERAGLLVSASCSGALPVPQIPAGGFFRPVQPENGTYILAGRVTNQPPDCPVMYIFDIEERPAMGPPSKYLVAFHDREELTALVGMGKVVPAGFIQFNPLPTEDGTRGELATAGPRVKQPGGFTIFRVKAMNSGGMQSSWSAWKRTTCEDCRDLGFRCVSCP
jgi:hypothetical protein